MSDDDRTTEIGLARYAREYYDAAIAADNGIGSRPGYEIVAPAPVMFLVAHSIELALKAFLRWKGVKIKRLVSLGHNLNRCWEHAKKHGIESHVTLSREELVLLGLLSRLHSSTELRYIQTGYKEFPVFGPLQALATKILDTICPLVGYR